MGCKCATNFKNYLERESKKRKKPPKPEEIPIEEGKQNVDGLQKNQFLLHFF